MSCVGPRKPQVPVSFTCPTMDPTAHLLAISAQFDDLLVSCTELLSPLALPLAELDDPALVGQVPRELGVLREGGGGHELLVALADQPEGGAELTCLSLQLGRCPATAAPPAQRGCGLGCAYHLG